VTNWKILELACVNSVAGECAGKSWSWHV